MTGPLSAYNNAVLATPGLVSYWRLNEINAGTATDSMNSNPGTYSGVVQNQNSLVPTDTAGAAYFGGFDVLSSVVISDNANLDIADNISLEWWCKPALLNSTYQTVMSKYIDTTNSNEQYKVGINGSNNRFWLEYEVGSSANHLFDTTSLVAGNIYYVVVTRADVNAQFYVNGLPTASSSTMLTGSINSTSAVLGIGRNGNLTGSVLGEYMTGTLAHCAIYNQVLSAATVANHWSVAQANYMFSYMDV